MCFISFHPLALRQQWFLLQRNYWKKQQIHFFTGAHFFFGWKTTENRSTNALRENKKVNEIYLVLWFLALSTLFGENIFGWQPFPPVFADSICSFSLSLFRSLFLYVDADTSAVVSTLHIYRHLKLTNYTNAVWAHKCVSFTMTTTKIKSFT